MAILPGHRIDEYGFGRLYFANVPLSPPGGLVHESLRDRGAMVARCVADLDQGRWPEGCVVNPESRASWRW